jgi:hypothetical protein
LNPAPEEAGFENLGSLPIQVVLFSALASLFFPTGVGSLLEGNIDLSRFCAAIVVPATLLAAIAAGRIIVLHGKPAAMASLGLTLGTIFALVLDHAESGLVISIRDIFGGIDLAAAALMAGSSSHLSKPDGIFAKHHCWATAIRAIRARYLPARESAPWVKALRHRVASALQLAIAGAFILVSLLLIGFLLLLGSMWASEVVATDVLVFLMLIAAGLGMVEVAVLRSLWRSELASRALHWVRTHLPAAMILTPPMVLLFKGIRDVLDKDQSAHNVLVPGPVDTTGQRARHLLQFVLVRDGGGGVTRFRIGFRRILFRHVCSWSPGRLPA